MTLLRGSTTPSNLAAEHAKAKAKFDGTLASIRGRAQTAIKDARDLVKELETEIEEHVKVLEKVDGKSPTNPTPPVGK
jgi:signal transduction histidine kinase